jgi:hypothetical protein
MIHRKTLASKEASYINDDGNDDGYGDAPEIKDGDRQANLLPQREGVITNWASRMNRADSSGGVGQI